MSTTVPAPRNSANTFLIGAGLFVAILIVQIVVEWLMGRGWICPCGTVKLWENEIYSGGNSQHIADWYTPTHVIHGFLFYALAWLVFRTRTVSFRFVVATLAEAGWEILENSPIIIERYRSATISLDYFGDSILNSTMDTFFMALGFLLALRLPIWLTVLLALAAEIILAFVIRDNLTLNIVMLVWPIDTILDWQSAIQ